MCGRCLSSISTLFRDSSLFTMLVPRCLTSRIPTVFILMMPATRAWRRPLCSSSQHCLASSKYRKYLRHISEHICVAIGDNKKVPYCHPLFYLYQSLTHQRGRCGIKLEKTFSIYTAKSYSPLFPNNFYHP